jgi:hypothetical protein
VVLAPLGLERPADGHDRLADRDRLEQLRVHAREQARDVRVPQRPHVARAVERAPRDLRHQPGAVVRHRLVGDEQRRGHAGMAAQLAEVQAEAVVAAGAADVALAERMAPVQARVAPERLAPGGHRRADGRLEVERLGASALGHEHVAVVQPHRAVIGADELERGVERRRRAQRDLGGPAADVAGDEPAGIAPVRAGRRAVEAPRDEDAARPTVTGRRAAPH